MTSGLPAPNLALIGFMASGKTSVGNRLSSMTGLPFLDVDALVETQEAMSVAEIFARWGGDRFRQLEAETFWRVCQKEGQIIGCGGGTLLDPASRAALKSRCCAIWLRASADEIIRRIGRPGEPIRPLVEGKDPQVIVPKLLREREKLYEGADLVLDTENRSVEQIASEICLRLAIPMKPLP